MQRGAGCGFGKNHQIGNTTLTPLCWKHWAAQKGPLSEFTCQISNQACGHLEKRWVTSTFGWKRVKDSKTGRVKRLNSEKSVISKRGRSEKVVVRNEKAVRTKHTTVRKAEIRVMLLIINISKVQVNEPARKVVLSSQTSLSLTNQVVEWSGS